MHSTWMVIYPNGNKSVLSIAEVLDYEHDDWALASFKEFDEEKDAAIYARSLASKHNLTLDPTNKIIHILDLGEEE